MTAQHFVSCHFHLIYMQDSTFVEPVATYLLCPASLIDIAPNISENLISRPAQITFATQAVPEIELPKLFLGTDPNWIEH